MGRTRTIELSVPSLIDHLDTVQRVAEDSARLAGFDDEQQVDLGLAVREGAVNAMKHGNGFEESREVRVAFEINSESLKISITDQGRGFVPGREPDPREPGNLWRNSGRGLLLIRSLVDEVSVHNGSPGVTLVMVKKRPKDPPAAQDVAGA